MEKLTISIPHQLGRAEAKRRIQTQLGELKSQFGPALSTFQETWDGDEMEFRVKVAADTVEGWAAVEDQRIFLVVTLPWFLALLANGIRQQIEHQGRKMLAHHAATDAAPTSGRPS